MKKNNNISRRVFVEKSAITTAGLIGLPYINCGKLGVSKPMTREFGVLGVNVTTFGLGGQASIQWTPEGIDPVKIIIKAYDKGVNYFDTSNAYGPSQLNLEKHFENLVW